MKKISNDLVTFLIGTEFKHLPSEVVHEAKRSLLDAFGCAVAGVATDKGKISIALAKRLGGPRESTILGEATKSHVQTRPWRTVN